MDSKKEVLVLGMGISGRAVARLLTHQGYIVLAVDDRVDESTIGEIPVVNTLPTQDLRRFCQVVVSPGIAPTHSLYSAALAFGIPVIGEVEWALRHARHRLVGITGTNGKTTVTSMVAHALQHAGLSARAVGNIGVPLSEALLEAEEKELLVVELSSWQLETMQTRAFCAAAILNITPDHLDRHGTMENYAQAKLRLSRCLLDGAPLFISPNVVRDFPGLLPNKYQKLTEAVQFEEANRHAAWALCQHLGVDKSVFEQSLLSFKKPPHRMEKVASIAGVDYYNDSKGTNVDAVLQAVAGRTEHCIVIAGGVDKGLSFAPWRAVFQNKVRCLYAIGQTAKQLQQELSDVVPVVLCHSLEEAVHHAHDKAKPGDSVLLSPGCSSFDQFDHYQHRGEVFRQLVQTLAANQSEGDKS